MKFNSTRFLSFSEINVDSIDLHEDAFGLYPEISDVDYLHPANEIEPEPGLVNRLIEKIRKNV